MSPRSGSKGDAAGARRLDQANARAARRPKRRRRPTGERQRVRDTRSPLRKASDRSVRLLKFGRRHKAGILGWVGIVGLCASMLVFSGVTQALAGGVSLAAAGTGAAIRHHERTRALNSGTTHTASRQEIRDHQRAMREAMAPAPAAGPKTVKVTSHTSDGHGVRAHTRAAPGQGKTTKSSARKPPRPAGPQVRGTRMRRPAA